MLLLVRESCEDYFLIMANLKSIQALILIGALCNLSFILQTVYGAEDCGKSPLNRVAVSLMPCLGAAKNAKTSVPSCLLHPNE